MTRIELVSLFDCLSRDSRQLVVVAKLARVHKTVTLRPLAMIAKSRNGYVKGAVSRLRNDL